jgi:hypothetical protein
MDWGIFSKTFSLCSDHGKMSGRQEGFLCLSKVVTYIGTGTVPVLPVLDCSSFTGGKRDS